MEDFFFPKRKIERQKQIAKIPLLFDVDTYFKCPLSKPSTENLIIKKSKHAAEVFLSHWNHKTICFQEQYMTIYQKLNGTVLGMSLDAIGDEDHCFVNYTKILRRAKQVKAQQVITAHNHIDDSFPSATDSKAVKILKTYLKESNNITLADHIIITPSRKYFSFKSWFML